MIIIYILAFIGALTLLTFGYILFQALGDLWRAKKRINARERRFGR